MAVGQPNVSCEYCRPARSVKSIASGATSNRWTEPLLAYFATDGVSNGGTEATKGLIELDRRIARGLRNCGDYRLSMLLIGAGLTP